MIERILRCDKCNCIMKQEWARVIWRCGSYTDLCKDSTRALNKWLNEGKE